MDGLPPIKKDWTLTRQSLEGLLAFLHPDREKAASQYELIRKKLIAFFQGRGCSAPEDYTDITINRVARKISEGVEIHTINPSRFFFGVARKVLQESWNDLQHKSTPLDDPSVVEHISQDPLEVREQASQRLRLEQSLQCLDRCLKNIPSKNQDLIIQYYQGDTSVKIKNRKKLAQQLGIPVNALRIRALRIREKLEECVKDCVKQLTRT